MAVITGWKFKIVERGGAKLSELLVRANMFDKAGCGRGECLACRDAKKPQNCRRQSILYETSCQGCLNGDGEATAKYVGESSRSGCERYNEHVDDAKKGHSDSHMYKHWVNQHGGVETPFKFEIIGFFKTPLERQVAEAVRLQRTGAVKILNSKSVYSRSSIP